MEQAIHRGTAMSDEDHTVSLEHTRIEGRTIAALSLALADGRALADVDIDLSDPEQCKFGAYTLVERIGAGGMGLVYRAHQISLERDIAIKLLNLQFSADSDALARFRFEAKSAAALNHPNIVQILEIGDVEGVAFIAMQLVRGETLAERIQRQRMDVPSTIALMLKLCDAVGYAHRLQLLHLDLKPSNVLINERGEPLVADFGLARHMNAQGQVQAQEVSGTPGYMAPEQVLIKEFRLSVGTDIYALGAILYELLCGQSPHGRGESADVIQRALAGQIASPRKSNPSVPKDLEAICMKCLSLRATERYLSVEAFADDLRRYANSLPVSVRSPTRIERLQRWYVREPRFALALGAMLMLAIVGSAVFSNLYRNAERQRAGAEGLVRILMAATPVKAPPIMPTRDYYKLPLIDCALKNINCNGVLDAGASIDPTLPIEQRRRYVASLRDYVPKIAAWGNSRLSAQLASTLDGVDNDLYRSRRASAAAATDTANGYLFAYLLSNSSSGDPNLGKQQAHAWLQQAVTRIAEPWQAQVLAESCDRPDPICAIAIERFRQIDPDNAAAWLTGMPEKPSDHGDRMLLRAAIAPRISHAQTAFFDAAMTFGERLAPMMDADARVAPADFALETWSRVGSFEYPSDYCRRSLAERDAPAIETACSAVVHKAEHDPKRWLIDELAPSAITMHMSGDPTIRSQAWRRLRNARWIYSVWQQLPAGSEPDADAHARAYRDLGELAYLKSLVVAAHLPLDAPENFVTLEPLPWPRHSVAQSSSSK